MSRKWLLCALCFVAPLLLTIQTTKARFDLRVDESVTRFSFGELAPEVSLAVENGSTQNLPARIRLELLEPDNTVAAASEKKTNLKAGSQKLQFTFPLTTRNLSPDEEDKILWYRLHYRITPDTNENDLSTIDGLISLSTITPELFEIKVAAGGIGRGGMRYHARVKAAHPITGRPAQGVQVRAAITLNNDTDDDGKLTSSVITNRDGVADLQFNLPADLTADDMELDIEATRALLTVKASKEIEVVHQPYVLVSTDKPLYQPGQTLHARVLIFNQAKRAVAAKAVTVKVTDPDDAVVFTADVETSRFGIANVEWTIPDNTRLGDYHLEFSTEDDDSSGANVKISRYDLPNFTVKVKPDLPYYLPGQKATIAVHADYLFGKPVSRGHVRLVRETERSWNYREQKYETVEGDKYEGEVGSDGTFKAQINLAKDHAALKEEDYRRYNDLPYAAYFTDPTTRRTEQRRFNIRVTKEAIHIYVIRPNNSYYESPSVPLHFFVSTFYADGSPAQCNLTISRASPESPNASRVMTRTTTSRYGVAGIDQIRLSREKTGDSEVTLNLVAQDKAGNTGRHAETYQLTDDPAIQVRTAKALYSAGEPIVATIISSEQDLWVTVDVARDWSVIHSETVKLSHGRATIELPYKPEYKDELTIAAYADREDDNILLGTQSILYPRNRDLKLNLRSTAQSYKPGEQAHVSFRAVNPEGRSVESALGIVVLDRAVEERVRTDQEFGARYASFNNDILSLLGYGESLGVISRRALEQLDMSKPIAPDLQLAAEALLNQGQGYYPKLFGGDNYQKNQKNVFAKILDAQFVPVRNTLKQVYDRNRSYPIDAQSLQRILTTSGIDFQSLRDPWGTEYRPAFFAERSSDVCTIQSAGADKRFDTADDFQVARFEWAYFRATGEAINAAVLDYHQRTGGFIRDFNALSTELQRQGVNISSLRDPWGKPYSFEFEIYRSELVVSVSSTTPLTNYEGREYPPVKFQLWQSRIDYFAETRAKIDLALAAVVKKTGHFPFNEAQFRADVQAAAIDFNGLTDPWGRNYYVTFHTFNSYGDRAKIVSQATLGETARQHIEIQPVTRTMTSISVRSAGADHSEGTIDDFTVGEFSGTVMEQSATDDKPQTPRVTITLTGSTGAIAGTVVDLQGAAVPGAIVKASRSETAEEFSVETDDNGKYILRNLPAGMYSLRIEATGFKAHVVTNVYVRSSTLLEVNATLDVGGITETVSITSEPAATMNMSSATVSESKTSLRFIPPAAAAKQQLFTPRLREYFPETLLWQPELTTDKKGRAQLDFKLADNITTWKLSVIGSTEDGELGTAETEIQAFQPFFAELDPPRVLTEGDRISLPVVLRNYLDRKQSVDLELKPESWFTLLNSNKKRADVPAGDSANETFDLKAIASIKEGKQRITALGSESSDAIEKPVTVHPDGEEIAETTSDILHGSTVMNVRLPADTITNSAHVELKVYPNLMAHVWESVEGIMQRPYGCGEQTISSTYPSLFILRNGKGMKSAVADKARRYVQTGYQRLLGYQSAEGGFTYWGKGKSDVALTAYALRFLNDASDVIPVDQAVLSSARAWLLSQQHSDGSWLALDWDQKEDPRRTAMLTAVVARSLALMTKATKGVTSPSSTKELPIELTRALNYLQIRSEEIDEPYLIASYALASSIAGDNSRAMKTNARLNSLAHSEFNATYWALETNTPFYGWGLAGRVETSALAVQSLARTKYSEPQEQQRNQDLQSRGLLFLLRNKDRYGVWYSTQATINVLDAMLSLLSEAGAQQGAQKTSSVEILVNDQRATSVELPSSNRVEAPLLVDLSGFVKNGDNRIEVRRQEGGSPASVQVVATYYVPWATTAATETARTRSGDSESLRLETSFDKKEARVSEAITCHVKVERLGFRGYGMLLAEIGLPPGAEVDRASLENAMRGSDWSLSHYDVLPDRVVMYLWPRAGGSTFDFSFRPRFAMTAKSSASVVYDYYNPEARAVVRPGKFVVR